MTIPPAPPDPSEPKPPPAGVSLDSQRDVNIQGDLAGRDVVTNVTQVGLGARDVQRLIMTVGLLVFVTAGCFFSGGALVGGAAIVAFNRQVASSVQDGEAFNAKLNEIRSLPHGQPFVFALREVEISSYAKFFISDQLGMRPETAKVRLLESGQLLLAGDVAALGGLPVVATFEVQFGPDQPPLRLTGAMVRLIPAGESSFGWVWVPAILAQPLADAATGALLGDFYFTELADLSHGDDRQWVAGGVTR